MNTQYVKYSKLQQAEKFTYFMNIYQFVKILKIEYPDFDKWFYSLFDEECQLKRDREIIICDVEKRIAGVAILKKTANERKICTLRVAKKYQHNGIGKHLMELSLAFLEDEKPMITMHKSKYAQFASLLDYYGFSLEQKQRNYYSIFSTELVYNGALPQKKFCLNGIEILDFYSLVQEFLKTGSYDFEKFVDAFLCKCAEREMYRFNFTG